MPTGTEDTLFGNGVNLKVTIRWDAASVKLYLNDNLVQVSSYSQVLSNWTAASIFDLGAYEYLTYGGYYTSDDVIAEFTVIGPPAASTNAPPAGVANRAGERDKRERDGSNFGQCDGRFGHSKCRVPVGRSRSGNGDCGDGLRVQHQLEYNDCNERRTRFEGGGDRHGRELGDQCPDFGHREQYLTVPMVSITSPSGGASLSGTVGHLRVLPTVRE